MQNRRKLVNIAILMFLASVVLVFFALLRPQHDFIEYWTASHLLTEHQNPYSLARVFQREKAMGWTEPNPVMFVSPPWVLPLLTPLALTDSYSLGWLAWMVVLIGTLAVSSRLLMDL